MHKSIMYDGMLCDHFLFVCMSIWLYVHAQRGRVSACARTETVFPEIKEDSQTETREAQMQMHTRGHANYHTVKLRIQSEHNRRQLFNPINKFQKLFV